MTDISDRIQQLYRELGLPMLAVVAGAALILGIWMGVGFILADGDDQKIKKAKSRVAYFVVGFIVIFVVAGLTPLFVAFLQDWALNG